MVAPDDPRPTLYLTNWSSAKLHGPGRHYTIMANPREWEHGDGTVPDLCPRIENLEGLQERFLLQRAYRDLFLEALRSKDLSPGVLRAFNPFSAGFPDDWPVEDGDSLLCACARGMFKGQIECRRAWAAPFLVAAGWRVILDGVEVA